MKKLLIFLLGALWCYALTYIKVKYYGPEPEYRERTVKVIQTDTIFRFVSIPNVIIYKDIPAITDTAAIINDYFASVTYADTVISSDNAQVSIKETIEHNRIKEREIHLLTTATIVRRPISDALWMGLTLGSDPSASCLWQHKNWGFGGGFAFRTKTPFISVSRKIHNF